MRVLFILVWCPVAWVAADFDDSALAQHVIQLAEPGSAAVEMGMPPRVSTDATYEVSQLKGEPFAFVSDGVVEAANANGELFGFDRTHDISGKSAQEISAAAKAWGQNDDITVVTVRRNA